MKEKIILDLGQIMDEFFEAARGFGDVFHDEMKKGKEEARDFFYKDENVDYYPNYSYPPMNVYLAQDKSLIFEFALAGFQEKDLNLEFQGDYMIFSAGSPEVETEEPVKYFKRRLKMKPIKEQKYYVPEDKFDREGVKAVFKNGILKITVPPTEVMETKEGIKIEIVKEDEV